MPRRSGSRVDDGALVHRASPGKEAPQWIAARLRTIPRQLLSRAPD